MEPLGDEELDVLLREGQPVWRASPEFDARMRIARGRRWWEWLWCGSVRVPVPMMVVFVVILGVLAWNRMGGTRRKENPMDQFQPVRQLEIRLVRSGDEH